MQQKCCFIQNFFINSKVELIQFFLCIHDLFLRFLFISVYFVFGYGITSLYEFSSCSLKVVQFDGVFEKNILLVKSDSFINNFYRVK